MLQKGICGPPECQHCSVMGAGAWGRGFAAFAKVPLGKALILHWELKAESSRLGRDLYGHVTGSCCLSLLDGSSPLGFPKTGSGSRD